MKPFLAGTLAVALCTTAATAQRATWTAAPSTRGITVVTISAPRGTQAKPDSIRLDYGQPHLRGRSLHSGNLVPMDSVWRLGANEATSLRTTTDITIGGAHVPAGNYTLFALPTSAGWKLIINKNTGQWGTDYKVEHDLVRVDLKKSDLHQPIESFSMWMTPAAGAPPRGTLRFAWGAVELSTEWAVR